MLEAEYLTDDDFEKLVELVDQRAAMIKRHALQKKRMRKRNSLCLADKLAVFAKQKEELAALNDEINRIKGKP